MRSFFLIFIVVFFISGCKKSDDQAQFQPYDGPDAVLKNSETLFSDSAVLRVNMTAPLQYQYNSGDQEYPEGVFIRFFDEAGDPSSKLTANEGEYDAELDLYTVSGNVVVQSLQEDKVLKTEKLHWDPAKEQVRTPEDHRVHIKTPTEIVKGFGLVANQDFSEYEILNPEVTIFLDE